MRTWIIFGFMTFVWIAGIIGLVVKHQIASCLYIIIGSAGMAFILKRKGILP